MEIMIINSVSTKLGEKRKNITDAAKETGLSRATLTALYNETSTGITYGTLNSLCQYFGCDVGDLLRYKEGK